MRTALNSSRSVLRVLLDIIDGKVFLNKGKQWWVDEDILMFNTPIMALKTTKDQR